MRGQGLEAMVQPLELMPEAPGRVEQDPVKVFGEFDQAPVRDRLAAAAFGGQLAQKVHHRPALPAGMPAPSDLG